VSDSFAFEDTTERQRPGDDAPLSLLVVGAATVESIRLPPRGAVVIGRAPDCDVRIADPSVSRRHARLHVAPLVVEDLGSANGTRVGARAVAHGQAVEIAAGEAFTLGEVTFFVQRSRATAGTHVRTDGHFDARLAAECVRAGRYALRFALITLSADGAAGVLDAATRAALRPMDVMRIDPRGEAHVLVVHAGREAADALVERIAAQVPATLRWDVGVAVCPDDAADPGALFEVARARARPLATPSAGAARDLIAEDPASRALLERLGRLASTDLPVLLSGEPGVGKRALACWLRAQSRRARGPFVQVRCGALPEAQLEAELFGLDGEDRPGALESADGGTLLIERVELLPPSCQERLAHALEYGQAYRVGSTVRRPVRVRLLATTTRAPARRDPLRRLAPAVVDVAPLRERLADVEPLARRFAAVGEASFGFTDEAIAALRAHDWPGNVRELRAVVERAAVLARSERVEVTDLDLPAPAADAVRALRDDVDDLERERIEAALAASGGNRSRAARALGIARNTLLVRLRAYGLTGPRRPE
jgi:transcriptional regulator with AAA-type ATPase domain